MFSGHSPMKFRIVSELVRLMNRFPQRFRHFSDNEQVKILLYFLFSAQRERFGIEKKEAKCFASKKQILAFASIFLNFCSSVEIFQKAQHFSYEATQNFLYFKSFLKALV